MTLKQLEAFYWAATCSSFALAAQRVHLTVSSLSKRLAELEASLGEDLFDRAGQRAVLTPAGRRLLPQAADLLRRAEQLKLSAAGAQGLQGSCRIGCGELASLTWLPAWTQRLRQAHPGLELSVVVDIGAGLVDRLERGELDAAVVAGEARSAMLRAVPLAQAAFAWCAAPALAERIGRLDAAAWATQTLVALPRGSGVTRLLDEWMERERAEPERVLSCSQWGAVAGLVVSGQGIGLLPTGLARALQERGRVRVLPSRTRLRPLAYGFHFRDGDPRPLLPELRRLAGEAADFDVAGPFF